MQPMSAFEWKGDSEIRTILRRNRQPELAADDPGYSRLSPIVVVRKVHGNVAVSIKNGHQYKRPSFAKPSHYAVVRPIRRNA
jgi:hypothetical protein